jgi:hypothetical protein
LRQKLRYGNLKMRAKTDKAESLGLPNEFFHAAHMNEGSRHEVEEINFAAKEK